MLFRSVKAPKGKDLNESLIQVDCFAGRIRDFPSYATAVPQREYVWKIQYQTYWTEKADDLYYLHWIRDFYCEMYEKAGRFPNPFYKPETIESENQNSSSSSSVCASKGPSSAVSSSNPYGGCYIGYPDVDLNTLTGSPYGALYLYYGQNLLHLVKVKAAVDPHNYFRNAQSIPVDHVKFNEYFGLDPNLAPWDDTSAGTAGGNANKFKAFNEFKGVQLPAKGPSPVYPDSYYYRDTAH